MANLWSPLHGRFSLFSVWRPVCDFLRRLARPKANLWTLIIIIIIILTIAIAIAIAITITITITITIIMF